MNGFGFIEYEDAMDAKDVVPGRLTSGYLYHVLITSQPTVCA